MGQVQVQQLVVGLAGGSLNTARNNLAGSGTQTEALAFGGAVDPKAQTEQYDGSSWTEVNDMGNW